MLDSLYKDEVLVSEIRELKRQKNAVIVGHYYQSPEIQDVSDFIGDSLDLSRKALNTDADMIVFCGVKFMAEVAKILNPNKLVVIPDENAGCSLEESCSATEFRKFREKYPDHISLTYINCSAEVKALSDIIVTSSNAEKIIGTIPETKPILFAPDKYLGSYLKKKTGRKDMVIWDGVCVVHEQFSEKELVRLQVRHSSAYVIAHPECPEHLLERADFIGSTSKLLRFVVEHPDSEFIVLTEPGIIHQMKKNSPNSKFITVPGTEGGCDACNECPYMKLNTLEKLHACMLNESYAIELDDDIVKRASLAIKEMLHRS